MATRQGKDEAAYQDLRRSMLGLGEDEDDDASFDDAQAQASEDNESDDGEDMEVIKDETETNLMSLRRTIYLMIMSSVDSEEAGHKLLSVVRPGQEMELCRMVVECCWQERTYTLYYGQLGQRLCGIHRAYQAGFEACFARHLSTAHRMEANELRGTARFFAHLLATDAVWWRGVLGSVRVTEEETTSSSRIFIKMLFQELSQQLGIRVLSRRMNDDDPVVREALFPRDSSKNTRFAINFFTDIGLGGITELARNLV